MAESYDSVIYIHICGTPVTTAAPLQVEAVNPDGIIASESANNASCGGSLIPLLTLEIPEYSTTTMMVGTFMLQGLQPGPLLIRDNPEMILSIHVTFKFDR